MLSYASMPLEARKLANKCLGRGVLKSFFKGAQEYHLLLKIEAGELVGFGLYHFEETTMAGETRLLGIVDIVLVDVASRRQGYGSEITFSMLRKMSNFGVERVEVLVKEPTALDRDSEPGVPLAAPEAVLGLLGFRRVSALDSYYAADSLRHRYECGFCGNVPDSCRAVLYAKDSLG